jgi:ComF family protein
MKAGGSLRANSSAAPGSLAARGFTGGWFKDVRAALLSVVFPAGCRICDQLLSEATRIPICNECLDSFGQIAGTVCDKCGRPVEGVGESDAETFVCPRCANDERGGYAFDRVRSWAAYEGALVRAILLLKFDNIDPLGKLFARRLAEVVVDGGAAFQADVVVPVPLHRQRERERGYNQAALIAKPLAKRLGLPYESVLLTRIRPRPDKHSLSYEERWESVRGAFATRPGSQVDNLRVLLVDDVMTSGATLDSCAKTLREAGARSVIGLTVARAVLRNATERLR